MTGDPGVLAAVDRRMAAFYGEASRRARYQAVLETVAPEKGGLGQ